MKLAAGWIALLFWFFGALYKPYANHRHARVALEMLGCHSVWLTPMFRERVSHSDSGLNTVGGVLACPCFVNDWHFLQIMPLSNVERRSCVNRYNWIHRITLEHQYMSPLEKVVFEKNMCLADTSVRGKKWQMALFQVGSYIANLKWCRLFFTFCLTFSGTTLRNTPAISA